MIVRMTEFLAHLGEVGGRAEQDFQCAAGHQYDIARISRPRRHADAAGQNIRQSAEDDTENGLRGRAGGLNVLKAILNLIGSLHLAFDFGDEAGDFERGQLQSRHKLPSDTLNVGRSRMLHLQSRHPVQQWQKIHDIGDMDRDG